MVVEITPSIGTGKFVQKVGDTMTGDLEFLSPDIGVILESSTSSIVVGNPIGLLLALTYSDAGTGAATIGSPIGLLLALTYSSGTTTRWRLTVNSSGTLVITAL